MRLVQREALGEVPAQARVGGLSVLDHRCIGIEQDVDGRDWVRFFESKYRIPVILHVHYGPAFGPGLIEPFVEPSEGGGFPVVGPLTVGVRVVDIEAESPPAAGGCPLEHLQVTVRIAERGDGAPANMHLDADGLALPVINKLISGRRTSTGFPSRSSNFVLMLVPMTCSGGTP